MTKRGIVVEVQKHKAIILTKDGSFETISIKKKQNLLIGQEIDTAFFTPVKQKKIWSIPSLSTAAAAALIVLLLFVSGTFPFQHNDAVAAYVSFDINPSIEVSVNKDMQVVKVRYLNKDGRNLFSDDEVVKYMPLEDFSKELMNRFKGSGYFNRYENMLIATALEAGITDHSIKESLTAALSAVENDPIVLEGEVQITVLEADSEKRKTANEHGVSIGKYAFYEETLEQENLLTIKDLQNLSYDQLHAKALITHDVITKVNKDPSSTQDVKDDGETENSLLEPTESVEYIEEESNKEEAANSVNGSAGEEKLPEKGNNSPDNSLSTGSVYEKIDQFKRHPSEVKKQIDIQKDEREIFLEKELGDSKREVGESNLY